MILLIAELALLLITLWISIGTDPQVIEVVVTATPVASPTPTPDWSSCVAKGQGWYWCP